MPPVQKQEVDEAKLAELIVFFAKENEGDKHFSATKLNKLLFLADFLAYGHLGHSITGATYVHQDFGPTPKPSEFLPILKALVAEERIALVSEETYRGPQQRPVALSKANQTLFAEEELAICRDAIEALRPLTNVESSDWSHDFTGWLCTKAGESIPYETVYLWRKEPASIEDIEWAKKVARQMGMTEMGERLSDRHGIRSMQEA